MKVIFNKDLDSEVIYDKVFKSFNEDYLKTFNGSYESTLSLQKNNTQSQGLIDLCSEILDLDYEIISVSIFDKEDILLYYTNELTNIKRVSVMYNEEDNNGEGLLQGILELNKK